MTIETLAVVVLTMTTLALLLVLVLIRRDKKKHKEWERQVKDRIFIIHASWWHGYKPKPQQAPVQELPQLYPEYLDKDPREIPKALHHQRRMAGHLMAEGRKVTRQQKAQR